MWTPVPSSLSRKSSLSRPATPSRRLRVEELEQRQLLSAAYYGIANSIVRSAENYGLLVTNLYNHYLNRPADPGGLQFWAAQLESGATDQHVEASLLGSAEFINDHGPGAAWITALYKAELGRTPDPAGLQGWETALSHGVSPTDIASGIVMSQERLAGRVNDDYLTYLGRSAEPGAINYWSNALGNGLSDETVMASLLASPEYYNHVGLGNDTTWLLSAYSSVLHRQPGSGDYAYWLGESPGTAQSQIVNAYASSTGASVADPQPGSPLQGVVQVSVSYPDGKQAVGSGALVDSYHVVTAGHILYSASDGGYATSIKVVPAAQPSGAPFGAALGVYERVDPSWLGFSASHAGLTSPDFADIGLVTLNTSIGPGTGYFTLGSVRDGLNIAGYTFQAAGYPTLTGLTAPQMFVESAPALGTVSTYGMDFSQSRLPAVPGQSGSPIWQLSGNGYPNLFGVLTGASGMSSSDTVYATRLTSGLSSEISGWIGSDRLGLYTTLQHPPVVVTGSGSGAFKPVLALDSYWGRIGEVNPYTGSSLYNYYDPNGVWSGQYYSNPYGSYYFSTPDWYQQMAYDGYSRIGEVNAYTGDTYYNYYNSQDYYSGWYDLNWGYY
jgi:V8-like Glu-specific endopeptidase